MKKVLFATTALVASTGFAAAQVAVTGSAEMGVNDTGAAGSELQFFQDIDVTFTMSGETDGGLSFGAAIDLDESTGSAALGDTTDDGGVAIFISGDFGTLTMGDTDGAMDWALTDAGNNGNGGSIDDAETSYSGYVGAYLDGSYDGQIVRYDNTFGDFGFAISVEADETGVADAGFAIGGTYSFGDFAMGLAYQEESMGTARDLTGLSVSYSANGLTAGIVYATGSVGAADRDVLGIGLGYAMDAWTAHINYMKDETGATTLAGTGLSVGYDLGGGASLVFGANDEDQYSFGLSMSF